MRKLVPHEQLEQTILVIRGHRVMLDTDLAKLYGVLKKAQSSSQTKPHPLPGRFHVPTHG